MCTMDVFGPINWRLSSGGIVVFKGDPLKIVVSRES